MSGANRLLIPNNVNSWLPFVAGHDTVIELLRNVQAPKGVDDTVGLVSVALAGVVPLVSIGIDHPCVVITTFTAGNAGLSKDRVSATGCPALDSFLFNTAPLMLIGR